MDNLWVETFRYNRWANLRLLDACANLSDEQLEWTAPGTYGTIASTFQHLIGAEQRYLRRFDGSEPSLNAKDKFPGIARLRALAADSGDRLIKAATTVTPDDTIESKSDEGMVTLHLGVVIIQALHHGNDHRTHICTILGYHDFEYGEMDVWAYGEATGAIVPMPASS